MTGVAGTSLDAYHAHTARDLSQGQQRVLSFIKDGRDYTRAELAAISGIPINVICPRVSELITAGCIEPAPRRRCSQTGNDANPVRKPLKQPQLF